MDGERTARSDTAQPSPRRHTLRENIHVLKHALLLRVLGNRAPYNPIQPGPWRNQAFSFSFSLHKETTTRRVSSSLIPMRAPHMAALRSQTWMVVCTPWPWRSPRQIRTSNTKNNPPSTGAGRRREDWQAWRITEVQRGLVRYYG